MQLKQHLISNGSIQLIPMKPKHQELFVELYSNKKIMRQVGEPLLPEAVLRIFTEAMASRNSPRKHYYWIIKNADNTEAGMAAVMLCEHKTVEVGVMLLSQFSRQGLALNASASLFEYAFRNWQMDTIVVSHKPANLPVPVILGKLSMQCITQAEDIWWWQLKQADWQTLSGHVPYQFIAVEEELYDN